ncbi:MAG: hypothetical protein KM296_00105 [Brockia lithotrophica]|nr:hypothetical protein [Brockia lithotrophica]
MSEVTYLLLNLEEIETALGESLGANSPLRKLSEKGFTDLLVMCLKENDFWGEEEGLIEMSFFPVRVVLKEKNVALLHLFETPIFSFYPVLYGNKKELTNVFCEDLKERIVQILPYFLEDIEETAQISSLENSVCRRLENNKLSACINVLSFDEQIAFLSAVKNIQTHQMELEKGFKVLPEKNFPKEV